MAASTYCDEISNENIIFWLKRTEEWSSLKNFSNTKNHVKTFIMRDISQNAEILAIFLSSVHGRLENDSVAQVLRRYPKLGHLLGRLSTCGHLFTENEKVYSQLFHCVQALRRSIPQDGMERKAKEWAESQIRHTASYYNQTNPASATAESMGYTALEYNILSSDKLIESIQRDLDYLINEQEHFLHGIQANSVSLEDLSLLCLPLVGRTSSHELIDRVLLLHSKDTDDQISQLFLERLMETQAGAYDMKVKSDFCLTQEAMTSLWLRYLPALEQEILLLLQALSKLSPDLAAADVLKLINSRNLPSACAKHKILYEAVDSIVQQVLWETVGNHTVTQFIHSFQVAVNEAIQELNSSEYSVIRLFPERLHPLVNLLAVDLKDLPLEAQAIHLTSIQTTLEATLADPVVSNNPQEVYAVWMTLVKFLHWYHAAVYALIRGGGCEERCFGGKACLDLVIWFLHPLSFRCEPSDIKEDLTKFIRRICFCVLGGTFQREDLQRLISDVITVPRNNLPVEFFLSLLMAAVLQATSLSKDSVLEILDMVCSQEIYPSRSKAALLQRHLDIHHTVMMLGGVERTCPTHISEAIVALQDIT